MLALFHLTSHYLSYLVGLQQFSFRKRYSAFTNRKNSLHDTPTRHEISTPFPMLKPAATPCYHLPPQSLLWSRPDLPLTTLAGTGGHPCHHNIILSVFVAAIPMESSVGLSFWDITREEMRTMYRGCCLPCYRLRQSWGLSSSW